MSPRDPVEIEISPVPPIERAVLSQCGLVTSLRSKPHDYLFHPVMI